MLETSSEQGTGMDLLFMRIHVPGREAPYVATIQKLSDITELTPDVLHVPSLRGPEFLINRQAFSLIEIYPHEEGRRKGAN